MKTNTRMILQLGLGLTISVFSILESAFAEMSDQEFETLQVARKRDFSSFVKARANDASLERQAAIALREQREKEEARRHELELEYAEKMERYSMELVEQRDRDDEERLRKLGEVADGSRDQYVVMRERRRTIERDVDAVNPYEEFEIEIGREPESRVSAPEKRGDRP